MTLCSYFQMSLRMLKVSNPKGRMRSACLRNQLLKKVKIKILMIYVKSIIRNGVKGVPSCQQTYNVHPSIPFECKSLSS